MGQSRTHEFLPYESLLLLPGIPEVPGDRAGGGKEKSKGRGKEDSIGENWIRAAPAVSLPSSPPFYQSEIPPLFPFFCPLIPPGLVLRIRERGTNICKELGLISHTGGLN